MSKYIIEIAEEYEEYFKGVLICGIADGKFAVDVIAREDLEELNSDYINEHYGELQDEAYQKGINDGSLDVKQRVEGAYQRGLEDAWETAKKIFGYEIDGGLDIDELKKAFGSDVYCTADIIRTNTAEQAIAKLKAYDDKHSDCIEVGDVVERYIDGKLDSKGIYLEEDDGYWKCLFDTGAVLMTFAYPKGQFKKTGKHYDIQSILEAMRE